MNPSDERLWCAVVCCFFVMLFLAVPQARADEPLVTEAMVNVPIDTVWTVFTTGAGYELMGAAHADVDLRIGGRIRSHSDPKGVLGDAGDTEWEILAYEPQHLLASRPVQIPSDFPQRDAVLKTWHLVYLNSIAGTTTHIRVVTLGYSIDPASLAARAATAQRIRASLDRLVNHYRPGCARCAKPE